MKQRANIFLMGLMVILIAGVLAQPSGSGQNGSQLSAAALWTSGMGGSLRGNSAEVVSAASKQRIVANYGRLPLSFEANRGQTDTRVKFISRGSGYSLFLTGTEMVLTLSRPNPAAARAHAKFRGQLSAIGRIENLE